MSATGHRIAAAVCLVLLALAILGIVLEGGRLGWDLEAATSFGRKSAPLWFAIVAMSAFGLLMAVVAAWQLRLAART